MDNFIKEKEDFDQLLTYNPFHKKDDFFFISENTNEIFTILKNILLSKNGCGAIIGEKGTGKTTLIHRFINEYIRNGDYIYLIGSATSTDELFKEIMEYFADEKINPDVPIKEDVFFTELKKFLKELKEKNQRLFLIFDDAQNFPDEIFDLIEKICQLSIGKEKAVSVILLGDKKLEKKLNSTRHKDLRYQLKFFLQLKNLKPEETERFIKEFLVEKGIDTKIDKSVISVIHKVSNGNLEILNRILNSLTEVIKTNNLKKVNKKAVLSILDQLGLETPKEKSKIPKFAVFSLLILMVFGLFLLVFNKKEKESTETIEEVINKGKSLETENKPEPPKIFQEEKQKEGIKEESKVQIVQEEKKEEPKSSVKEEIKKEEKQQIKIPATIVEEQEKQKPKQEEQFKEVFNTLENEVGKVSEKIYENYPKAVVLTKTLSLRTGPSTKYKKISDLYKNETVVVVDDSKGKWAKVIYKKEGKEIEGWVYKKFIKRIPKGKAVVTAPFLSVREKPTSKSKRIDKLPEGEIVELTGEKKGNWLKVKYEKDNEIKEGWVSKYFLAY
jgi:type II secretory pathway predicted ATPase ExeA/uncharacterized protein YgiM (DUF1202 family)